MTTGERTLHRRQTQFPSDLCVSDFARILQTHSPHQLRKVAGTCNGGSTPESLKLHIGDGIGGGIDLNLELHNVSAGWCTNETGTDVLGILIHLSNIAGRGVVV